MDKPFSSRLRWEHHPNPLTELLREKKQRGERILDLTVSNPAGSSESEDRIVYPESTIKEQLTRDAIFRYEPNPRGLIEAREAVAQYYEEIGAAVHPGDIILTASTSEGYSYLFKLLTDPGDEALIPQPSYPLFEFVAGMDLVELHPYRYRYRRDRWTVDALSMEAAVGTKTKALITINPGNPAGNYIAATERRQMLEMCESCGLALIADEVFYEYPSMGTVRPPSFAGEETGGLIFTLNGFSKMLGLPQMKLGWITLAGDSKLKDEARRNLELIADTYLSVNTPVMQAAAGLFALRDDIARQIRARCNANEEFLQRNVPESCSLLKREGGWSAVIELPEGSDAGEFALRMLQEKSVFVYPGHFYDFPSAEYFVVSLLTPRRQFEEGVARICV